MTDPIRDALDWLNQRLLPTLFGEGVDAAFLQSWASHARAALAAQPPVGDDDDRAALQGLLDRVHLAATDPAAWLGLKQGDGQSPADAPPPAPEGDPIRAALEQLIDRMMSERASSATVDAWAAGARAICAALAAQPPAPAASTTPDLDALLSPEGAYEGGTGQEDGAQLVSGPNGPEWWAPLYGCETLDNLLDRLRARILPHLRPPVAGIDVPGCDGDYGDVMDLCAAEGVDYRVGVRLLKRAREAWEVAAQPPAPTPAPASDEEREELASWLENHAAHMRKMESIGAFGETELTPALERAATLLRQPAPAVVPVAERPWEREGWCDAEGRCWMGDPGGNGFIPSWRFCRPEDAPSMNVSLPHWAIPIPQRPLGGEVA